MITNTFRRRVLVFIIAALAAAYGATRASAADETDSAGAAKAVLDAVAKTLAAADSFRLEADVNYNAKYSDSEESMTTKYVVSVKRTGEIAVRITNESLDTLLLTANDEFVQYMPEFEQYSVRPGARTIAELMQLASFEVVDPAMTVLASLAHFRAPTEGYVVRDLSLVGSESINGADCDHVRFVLNGIQYDMWVEKGSQRLIRRIQPDMAQLEEAYERDYKMEFEVALVANLPTWELNADVSEALLFTPPDGAEQVERFGPKSPAEKLAGTAAPDFTLPMMDGSEFTLSKERGKIVMLDFWATWCGPCRIAMPVLSEVSKEFADKGVKLISIDLEETPDDVKAFLAQTGLDVTVAFDKDSSVAAKYQVSGIPQTVIVDRDGTIRVVHVGLWAMPEFSESDTPEQQMAKAHETLSGALREQLSELVAQSPPQ
jgi:thiol-disulfide isomerase/thioredoxin